MTDLLSREIRLLKRRKRGTKAHAGSVMAGAASLGRAVGWCSSGATVYPIIEPEIKAQIAPACYIVIWILMGTFKDG